MEKTEFEIAASMLRGKLVDIARFYLSDEDEAEDIVQEAMLKLWLVRDRIDREKNISPMGMTVTRNLCIDRLRRLKTHPHESLTGHDAPDGQRSAQAMMEDHENAEWMRGAVRNLPDKYRAVLRMRQVEHLEMGEIARIIGATEGVVRTILSRARKQMMEQLKVKERLNMTTNKEDIRRWLDLYMEGKTSLEEEALLTEYFRSPDADKDFADFKTMFDQFDEGEPSFTEEEQERWMQSCPLEEIPGSSALQTVPPMLPKRIRRTRQIAVRWIAAASVAAACFFLGTTVSRKEATQPTNSIPMPPTILTEVKWKTDTVFIEKPVPTALTAKIITVRDTIVLPASHPKGQMGAALSTGQGTSSTETASIPLSDTALQDADTAARQQTMPHLADIQAEFQKQKRRMDEFSKQYEHIDPYYENLY